MTRININEYVDGLQITNFYMVQESEVKTARNGNPYAQLTLADAKISVPAKKWELTKEEEALYSDLESGTIVKVQATAETFNGKKQFKIFRLRLATDADQASYQMSDLVKTAPMEGAELYNRIYKIVDSMRDRDYRMLCKTIYEKNKDRLLYWPAAKKLHHNEMAGLLWHTYRMCKTALKLSEIYPNINKDLLVTGAVLHDIGKIDEIESNQYGMSDGYSIEGVLLGHLVMGVKMVEEAAKEAAVSEEKKIMVEHLIAAHHGKPDYGAASKPHMLEAQLLYMIDSIDMYAYVSEKEMEKAEPGKITEKVFVFDNEPLYKPNNIV